MENISTIKTIDDKIDPKVLDYCYSEFLGLRGKFELIQKYYNGNTAIDTEYIENERSNKRVKCNYFKKFVKTETSYSVGNDITFIPRNDKYKDYLDVIYDGFENLSCQHNINLHKTMTKFNMAYEISYIKDGEFHCRIVPPTQGFFIRLRDEDVAFCREYEMNTFEKEKWIDVYTKYNIYSYKIEEIRRKVTKPTNNNEYEFKYEYTLGDTIPNTNFYGHIPVGRAYVGDLDNLKELYSDTLFNDVKLLQDAIEEILSDGTNEVSDFRNAYLAIQGGMIDADEAKKFKKMGMIQSRDADVKIGWLTKDVNDDFMQNMLKDLEDKIYQISSHINVNEKMQSNTSSLALRSRLIGLEEKCKLNQKGLTECITYRLKMLFLWKNISEGTDYDYRKVKIKYSPNIPADDLTTSQIISQLGDRIPNSLAISLLSFVEDAISTDEQAKKESLEQMYKENENILISGFNKNKNYENPGTLKSGYNTKNVREGFRDEPSPKVK